MSKEDIYEKYKDYSKDLPQITMDIWNNKIIISGDFINSSEFKELLANPFRNLINVAVASGFYKGLEIMEKAKEDLEINIKECIKKLKDANTFKEIMDITKNLETLVS